MKSFLTHLQESGRLVTVAALLVGTFCFAMFQGGFVSWFVFFTVSPFLVYSLLLAFVPLNFTHIHREITPSKIERGEDAIVKVTFRNNTRFPIVFLTVQELGVGSTVKLLKDGQKSHLFLVGLKRDFEWTYELSNLDRGEHQFFGLEFVVTVLSISLSIVNPLESWRIHEVEVQISRDVTATVVKQGRGKKVIVYKYKRKSGYHKKNGHRQSYTKVKIEKINA